MTTPDTNTILQQTQQVLLAIRRLHAAKIIPPVPVAGRPAGIGLNGQPQTYPPPQARWYAVKYESDYGGFDPATLRQEPGNNNTGSPDTVHGYSWPWVYLPAMAYIHGKWLDIYGVLNYLREQCTWQVSTKHIENIVRGIGGKISHRIDNEIAPDARPAIAFRQPVVTRHRNRTRASQRPHTVLRRVIERENLLANRQPDRQTASTSDRRIPKPMRHYQPPPVAPHRTPTGGVQSVEDELRREHGLETIADAILAALSKDPPPPDKDAEMQQTQQVKQEKRKAKRLADIPKHGMRVCPQCQGILLLGACPNGCR